MIDPELQKVVDGYNRIRTAHDAQEMTRDQADAAVRQLEVFDAQGYSWSINPDTGNFMRAVPGSPAQPADQDEFAPNNVSPSLRTPPVVASAPWGPVTNSTPPWQPTHTSEAFTPPLPPPSRRKGSTSAPRSRSPKRAPGVTTGFLAKNRTILIIVVIIVVVVAVVLVSKKSTPTTSSTLPVTSSTLPVSSSTLPVTSSTLPTTSYPPTTIHHANAGIPSVAQMTTVFGAIGSGSAALSSIHRYVVVVGTHTNTVKDVAFFTGLADLSAKVGFTRATKTSNGALSKFTLRDGTTNTVLYSGHALWVLRGGVWKLATWPTFN
jgi:hypothetical protein